MVVMFFAQVWAISLVLNMKQKTRQPFPINNDGARTGLQVKQMLDLLEEMLYLGVDSVRNAAWLHSSSIHEETN